MRLKDIRTVIAGGGPDDIHEARRLALRATSGIADPARAAALQDRLLSALAGVFVSPAMGLEAEDEARQLALGVLDAIEDAIR